ncbi:MAG: cytochrome B6, partial [Acidobacteriota bacterium]|nr:cytochrome B6 [Acidobacteriota bacterium]
MSRFGPKDDTQPWRGAYAPYDLIKELAIAVGVITVLAVVLSILFSSPDDRPSTIAQWSRQHPVNFVATAAAELNGTSHTAEYGPPYNHSSGTVQHFLLLHPQRWLGVSHPIDTAQDYVIGPLHTVPADPALRAALAEYQAAGTTQRKAWGEAYAKPLEEYEKAGEEHKPPPTSVSADESSGTVSVHTSAPAGPVPVMMARLLGLAQSGGLDGALLTSNQFFQTDYTKPLLFMSDGGLLTERAEGQHLLGDQWGMMNETGSYPGQTWL